MDARYDILLLEDFTVPGNDALRVGAELRALAEGGWRVAIGHVPTVRGSGRIAGEIDACIRAGLAHILGPGVAVSARLAIVHGAAAFAMLPRWLRGVRADLAVCVAERAEPVDTLRVETVLAPVAATVVWAPTSPFVRSALARSSVAGVLLDRDWPIVGWPILPPAVTVGQRPRLGRVTGDGVDGWPANADDFAAAMPSPGPAVHVLGLPPDAVRPPEGFPQNWLFFDPALVAVERFLGGIDALACFPGPELIHLPDAIIAAALASRMPVVLSAALQRHWGAGPRYCEIEDAPEILSRLLSAPRDARPAPAAIGLEAFHAVVTELAGAPGSTIGRAPTPQAPAVPVALLVASNGVGLGHVARLLAVARRAGDAFRPVFVTLAQAAGLIEGMGYPVHYLPSQTDSDTDLEAWDVWFSTELSRLIDLNGARLVIYDGNNPTDGLVRAVSTRPDCSLVWLRQGMMGETRSPFAGNARYCDLVIAPGDYADAADESATEGEAGALPVDPILLLDDDDLLPREAARAALGLDRDGLAVLIHLGAGNNRDAITLTDRVMTELGRLGGIQAVIAEWGNALYAPRLWPQAVYVRGFPFARFFRAFDFSIGAAGYNGFHEVIRYGLPTIFIANRHRQQDDQAARAAFAESAGAAFALTEERLHELSAMLRVLLAEPARQFLREASAKLVRPNGASAVAAAVADLAAGRRLVVAGEAGRPTLPASRPRLDKPAGWQAFEARLRRMADRIELQQRALEAVKASRAAGDPPPVRRLPADLRWGSGTEPGPLADADPSPAWPANPLPDLGLMPPPGFAAYSQTGSFQPTLAVRLFGLDETEIDAAVARVADLQRRGKPFRPIFFIDRPVQEPFLARGYVAEYLAPRGPGAEADAARRRRVAFLERKWGVASELDLGRPAAADIAPAALPPPSPEAVPPPTNAPDPQLLADAEEIRGSGLFDAAWYIARNPDAGAPGVDPIVHYLTVGAARGADPSPLFQTGFYLAQMLAAGEDD